MNYRNFEILEGFRFRLDNNLLAVVEDSDNLTIYINEKKYCFINNQQLTGDFIGQIIKIRAHTEGIPIDEESLNTLAEIGDRTTLRLLIFPPHICNSKV